MHSSGAIEKGENSDVEESYCSISDPQTPENSVGKDLSDKTAQNTLSKTKVKSNKLSKLFNGPCNYKLEIERKDGRIWEQNSHSHQPSLKTSEFKCLLVSDHIRHCQCLTPRLHLYLLNNHHCSPSCYTKESADAATLGTSDTQEQHPSFKMTENELTEPDFTEVIKEERITTLADEFTPAVFQRPSADCEPTPQNMKRSNKKCKTPLLKVKTSNYSDVVGDIFQSPEKEINNIKYYLKNNFRPKESKYFVPKSNAISLRGAPKTHLKNIPPAAKDKGPSFKTSPSEDTKSTVEEAIKIIPKVSSMKNRVNLTKFFSTERKKYSFNLEKNINLPFANKWATKIEKGIKPNCKKSSSSENRSKRAARQVHKIFVKSDVSQKTAPEINPGDYDKTQTSFNHDNSIKKSATHLQEISRNLPAGTDVMHHVKNKTIYVNKDPKKKRIGDTEEDFKDIFVNKPPLRKKSIFDTENTTADSPKADFPPKSLHRVRKRVPADENALKTFNDISKWATSLVASEKNTNDGVSQPKKSKKLFQINKSGVFHSFSQNLIRISSVGSLTSSKDTKSPTEKTLENKVSRVKSDSFNNQNRNSIPSLNPDVTIKTSPSDDEDSSALPCSKNATSLAPLSRCKGSTLLQTTLLSTPSEVSTTDLQYLKTKIKTEPIPLASVKSETIIEECLNLTMEEGDTIQEENLAKLSALELDRTKNDSMWVSDSEKFPNFGMEEMRCTLCLTSFPDFITLVSHLEKHQRNGFILCYYCQKSFGDKTSMKRHMRTHTGEKPYQCKICEKRFSLPGNFKKHRDIHEDIRTEPCDICGRTFRRKEHLKYHRRTHTGEKPFKCSLCGSCFTARYSLQIHMNIHLGRKPYKCSDCGKAFCDKSTMRKHIRVHTGERPFNCEVCHKTFGESGSLTAHVAIHSHERPFVCTQCHLSFKTSGGLRQHIKTHIGNKQFSCKYCGMMFIQKYNMVMHERIHTGERPYECSECHRCFRSRSCLGKHVILHGGDAEKKYSCSHCEKRFFRKAHLKRHINTHLGIKEYECSFCSKRFSTSGSLKKHLGTFHTEGARSFPCIACGRTFKRSIYVATHKCYAPIVKIETGE